MARESVPSSPLRQRWVQPALLAHSTMTAVTQTALPMPLKLLFLQASISQCHDANGAIVPCK